ncbi:hypothetical protein J7K07_05405 [Candidatus Bathyarchaeota archaeon]|nr:hypothetical protein [Candidatus Bathyarchaeota archaeon]
MRIQKNRIRIQIIVGATFVIISFIISLFMVIGVIEKNYLLSFLAYSLSFAGVALGLIAAYEIAFPEKKRRRRA